MGRERLSVLRREVNSLFGRPGIGLRYEDGVEPDKSTLSLLIPAVAPLRLSLSSSAL